MVETSNEFKGFSPEYEQLQLSPQEVIDFMKREGNPPVTVGDISSRLSKSNDLVRRILEGFVKNGVCVKSQFSTRENAPFHYQLVGIEWTVRSKSLFCKKCHKPKSKCQYGGQH